jgi:flagellar assembly protein FliH
MMAVLREFLDDFGSAPVNGAAQASSPALPSEDLEALRLEVFETGYKAGWDDAIRAQSDDKTRISSAFGQHLQDLSFTYHEAYSRVMNAMAPLLQDIVGTLLPGIARASLGAHVIEELHRQAEAIGRLDVVIAVAPGRMPAVAPLIDGDFGFPIRLQEDDTLADEQADIRFGETELQIDLTTLVESVSEAVQSFAHDNRRKIANG